MQGMMLAVGGTGLVFSLVAYLVRLVEVGNHYASEATRLNSGWHAMMAQQYLHTAWMFHLALLIMLITLAAVGMAAVLGRILHSLHWRSVIPHQE
jgi:hypothetical protein